QNVSALTLISEVKIGDSSSARKEFIEIYNDGTDDVEITNWCINYITSSLINYKLSCFIPSSENIHLFLPNHTFALAVSNEFSNDPISPIMGDINFSARLSGVAGYVSLVDNFDNQIDDIGWGQADIDNNLISPPLDNLIFKRKINSDGFMQDTEVYRDDFEYSSMKSEYLVGNIYELEDLCSNIDGIQDIIPDGYENLNNECYPIVVDICPNLDGIQDAIPDGFLLDDNSNCINPDLCLNLPDIQLTIPDDYILDNGSCKEKALPINLTEIYPNAVGLDDGMEFIELYNPNSVSINLENYGINLNGKRYIVSNNDNPLYIAPNEYKAFYNYEIKFNLLNSSAEIYINSNDGTFIGEKVVYKNPKEGESWAFIDSLWEYTNQLTPNSYNIPSKNITKAIVADKQLKPCGPGQYRNSETNRCRNVVSSNNTTLKPCESGYERNPETNRCRKIASVLGDTTLKPCESGYERNPETNRCRKIISDSIPTAGYKVEQTNSQNDNGIMVASIAGVGTAAVGYGLWEWRKDLTKFAKTVMSIFHTNT
ncbi:MAG: hypothetical protein WBI29_03365, partial [Candidatus Saccharimonadales bacterium]